MKTKFFLLFFLSMSMATFLIVAACGDDDDDDDSDDGDDDDDDDDDDDETLYEQGVCYWVCDWGGNTTDGCYQPVTSSEECREYVEALCDEGTIDFRYEADFHCTTCADKSCIPDWWSEYY